MTLQPLYVIVCLNVPQLNRAIIATAGKKLTIGTKGDRIWLVGNSWE